MAERGRPAGRARRRPRCISGGVRLIGHRAVPSDDRRQRADDRRQRADDRGQRAEGSGRILNIQYPMLDVQVRQLAPRLLSYWVSED
ncbi:MAG: hypothetical protein FJ290_06035 [Planctomycetes bacterium]|nr:hypothetical protein [Planctomycetota bacterium]